jgi:hypothetical protein
MHDPTKVLMGAPYSSAREISTHDSDPSTFKAGLAVRRDSSNALSLAVGDGQWVGVSLGKSLSDTKKTAVARTGMGIPVLLEGGPARLEITISNYSNLIASTDDTLQFEHSGLSLDETLTFKASASTEDEVAAASSNNQTATNLAAKINGHSVLGTIFKASAVGAVVTVTAFDNDLDGTDFDVTYTDGSSVGLTLDDVTFTGGGGAPDFVTLGSKVYFSDTTGKADDPESESTISDAIYSSGVLTGIDEDGNEVYAAYIDMPGGL